MPNPDRSPYVVTSARREKKQGPHLPQPPEEFKGSGAVTTQIVLRELRGVWVINLEVSDRAQRAAENRYINLQEYEDITLTRRETALVKLRLR